MNRATMTSDEVDAAFDAAIEFAEAPLVGASDAVHSELLRAAAAANIPRASGRTAASLVDANHPDHIYAADHDSVEFGSSAPGATYNDRISIAVSGDAIAAAIEGARDDT